MHPEETDEVITSNQLSLPTKATVSLELHALLSGTEAIKGSLNSLDLGTHDPASPNRFSWARYRRCLRLEVRLKTRQELNRSPKQRENSSRSLHHNVPKLEIRRCKTLEPC